MAWISLFILFTTSVMAADLPRFLTKHSPDTLRYISMDGRYAYVQKKPGVLGMVSSFRSTDFLSESNTNDFSVKSSRFKARLAIESIPNAFDEMSLIKNHKIYVVDYGNTQTREIGVGRGAKLHLRDEWMTFYDMFEKKIMIVNLVTQKKFEIKLSKKANPFFIPDVEMVSSRGVVYSDINEQGYSAMVSYDLQTLTSNVIYKSSQTATRIELCQHQGYLAVGEFPYDGVDRGSKISMIPLTDVTNLAGLQSIYTSIEQDIGNMVCLPNWIYFVKTMNQDKQLNYRVTEAVKLELKTQNIEAKTSLKAVSQLLEMDGRVLIPFRGEFHVLEGQANIGEDSLKSVPTKEELQIDI
jgi:hypothetical protein